jgi:hypothetical protein
MAGRVTGAATPVKLTNGKEILEFMFSPLSDKDIDEIDEWLQARVIEIARESLKSNSSQRDRDETINAAIRLSVEVSLLSPAGARMISTVAGMTRLCWQSARKCHPDLSEAKLRSFLINPANIDVVNKAFARVNSVPTKYTSKNQQRASTKR